MMCAVLSKTLILLTELLTVRADKDLKEHLDYGDLPDPKDLKEREVLWEMKDHWGNRVLLGRKGLWDLKEKVGCQACQVLQDHLVRGDPQETSLKLLDLLELPDLKELRGIL